MVNVPRRNIGEKRMRFLREFAEMHGCSLYEALAQNAEEDLFRGTEAGAFLRLIESESQSYEGRAVSEILSGLLQKSVYEELLRTEGDQERLDNLAELLQAIYEYESTCGEETTLEHYLSHVALFTNSDAQGEADAVRLMTVHAAKGLEFDYVILCGMNEGIFPSRKVKTRKGMEEERRVAFVAMTRAKKRLLLTESSGRNIDGSPRYPSRFLLDIDEGLLEHDGELDEGFLEESRAYIAMLDRSLPGDEAELAFREGDAVSHPIFGPGVVKALDMEQGAYRIAFERLATERMISFKAKLAPR
ncbi:MAG: ATP-binding domain-containing protein [Lachnospiraceae bacterium]|nr:ATP-binding domain-containing protein [Lachnospiraceae bacterium]